MTTKFTPAQVRFFLNASLKTETDDGSQPTTLLEQFLSFNLPQDLRYRILAMKRRLISDMAPIEAQIKDIYESYQAAVAEDADASDDAGKGDGTKAKAKAEAKAEGKVEDEAAAEAKAKAEAKRIFDEDLKKLDNTPFEFGGKLILATQLANDETPLPADALAFLAIKGILEEWLMPFTVDNLPAA